jgi:hypothetical protein
MKTPQMRAARFGQRSHTATAQAPRTETAALRGCCRASSRVVAFFTAVRPWCDLSLRRCQGELQPTR